MQPPTYLTPGLGGKSLIVIGGWALAAGLIPWWMSGDEPVWLSSSWRSMLRFSWLLGVTMGVGSGLFWLATFSIRPVMRGILRMGLVVLSALMLSRLGTPDWIRHAVNMLGLLLIQTLLFAWLRLPPWQLAGSALRPVPVLARQFGIADLLVLTTAFAFLAGLVIRYVAPFNGAIYWGVTVLFWWIAPMISAGFVTASLARAPGRAIIGLMLGVLLAAFLATSISVAETMISDDGRLKDVAIPHYYLIVLLAFGATMFVFGCAGRWQPVGERAAPTRPSCEAE